MQNENFLSSEINIGDQPAPVVTDIENDASPDAIGTIPTLLNRPKMPPTSGFGYAIPRCQRCLPLGMSRGSLSDPFAADNSHAQSSHIAKIGARRLMARRHRSSENGRTRIKK
jgi:hypothetical protein